MNVLRLLQVSKHIISNSRGKDVAQQFFTLVSRVERFQIGSEVPGSSYSHTVDQSRNWKRFLDLWSSIVVRNLWEEVPRSSNNMVPRVRMGSLQMQWFKLTRRLWKITKLPMYVLFKKHEIRAAKLWSGVSSTTKTPHDNKQSLSFRFETIAAEDFSKKRITGRQVDQFLSLSETYA